jgi:hypothetical protein
MCFLVNKDLRRREAAAPSKARAADFLAILNLQMRISNEIILYILAMPSM